jgi:hypothetical protein
MEIAFTKKVLALKIMDMQKANRIQIIVVPRVHLIWRSKML